MIEEGRKEAVSGTELWIGAHNYVYLVLLSFKVSKFQDRGFFSCVCLHVYVYVDGLDWVLHFLVFVSVFDDSTLLISFVT